eukprot:gnl/MRDRNA2_/MRDRNA2_114306_c0_seq1.p1 gnl/MRDRNA2_/MRDRNA2_114306_c0~~gnl/MRDRNA2_/MRDRNA2_114306_c0_seq1.p1  ORF type:complete len:731 (+),score=134.74 gnl/MRDRNA2_/MRDRNA2_114306_c0_seq1:58-2250(+)
MANIKDTGTPNVTGVMSTPTSKRQSISRTVSTLKEGIAEGEGLPWLARATFFARRVIDDVQCGDMVHAGSAWSDVEAFCSRADDDCIRPVMYQIVGTTQSFLQEVSELRQQDLSRRLRVLQRELHGHCQALLHEAEHCEQAAEQWHRAMKELTEALCDTASRHLRTNSSNSSQADPIAMQGTRKEVLPSWCQIENTIQQGMKSCDQSPALWQAAVNYCVMLEHCFAAGDPKALARPPRDAMAAFPAHIRDTAKEIGTQVSELRSTLSASVVTQEHFEATKKFAITMGALLTRLAAQVEAADDRFEIENGQESLTAAVTKAVTAAECLHHALPEVVEAPPAPKPKAVSAQQAKIKSPSQKLQNKENLQSTPPKLPIKHAAGPETAQRSAPCTPVGTTRQCAVTTPVSKGQQPLRTVKQSKSSAKLSLEESKVVKGTAGGSPHEAVEIPGLKGKRWISCVPQQSTRSCIMFSPRSPSTQQTPRTPPVQLSKSASVIQKSSSSTGPAVATMQKLPAADHAHSTSGATLPSPKRSHRHVVERFTSAPATYRRSLNEWRSLKSASPRSCRKNSLFDGPTILTSADDSQCSVQRFSSAKLEHLEEELARAKQLTHAATRCYEICTGKERANAENSADGDGEVSHTADVISMAEMKQAEVSTPREGGASALTILEKWPQLHESSAVTPRAAGESALAILASPHHERRGCEERISLALLSLCRQPDRAELSSTPVFVQ